MANDIGKEYNALGKKYKLPSFKEIDLEFEISDFENENFLLRNILRKIGDRLEYYSTLINDLLQPDTASLSSLHETRFFTDAEKNDMHTLFKRMMKSYRGIIELVLENNEKKQAEFLNNFHGEWAYIKGQLLASLGKMKDSWSREIKIEEDLGYFG